MMVPRSRLVVYGAVLLAGVAVIGQVKAWLQGPDLRFFTLTRVRPGPVRLVEAKQTVKEKRTVIQGPVVVIKEPSPKTAKWIQTEFGTSVEKLHAEGKELVGVRDVPKAPYGGKVELTYDTKTGEIDSIFRAKPQPFLELGGPREAGIGYDPLNAAVRVYGKMDVGRVGPVVINGEVFAAKPLRPGEKADFGVVVNASVRF